MKKILLALLMVVAISVSVEFPFAIGSRSAVAQGTVVTINVPMTWERSLRE